MWSQEKWSKCPFPICINYLLVCGKLPQNLVVKNNIHYLSFHESRVQVQLNWVPWLWDSHQAISQSSTRKRSASQLIPVVADFPWAARFLPHGPFHRASHSAAVCFTSVRNTGKCHPKSQDVYSEPKLTRSPVFCWLQPFTDRGPFLISESSRKTKKCGGVEETEGDCGGCPPHLFSLPHLLGVALRTWGTGVAKLPDRRENILESALLLRREGHSLSRMADCGQNCLWAEFPQEEINPQT